MIHDKLIKAGSPQGAWLSCRVGEGAGSTTHSAGELRRTAKMIGFLKKVKNEGRVKEEGDEECDDDS